MKHVLSTHLFVNHRLTAVMARPDLSTPASPPWRSSAPASIWIIAIKAQIAELGHWFRDSELKLHSLHSPMYNDEIWGRSGPQCRHAHHRAGQGASASRWWTRSSAPWKSRRSIPFRYLIQHMGVTGEEFDERKVDAAFTALEELPIFRAAARRGDSAGEHPQRAFQRRAAARCFWT